MYMNLLDRHFVHGPVVLRLVPELPICIVDWGEEPHQVLIGAQYDAVVGVDDTVSLYNRTGVSTAMQCSRIQFVQKEGLEFVHEFVFVVVEELRIVLLADRIVDVAQG